MFNIYQVKNSIPLKLDTRLKIEKIYKIQFCFPYSVRMIQYTFYLLLIRKGKHTNFGKMCVKCSLVFTSSLVYRYCQSQT